MIGDFVYIFFSWFVLGFATTSMWGYPRNETFFGGLVGVGTGLILLWILFIINPQLERAFWEEDKEAPEVEYFGWYVATPWILLILAGVLRIFTG